MRFLKETIELRADSEEEAKQIIEKYRNDANEKGYILGAAGYTYKTKKVNKEIDDEAWVCKIVQQFSGVWDK